jgi:hypothetical protein
VTGLKKIETLDGRVSVLRRHARRRRARELRVVDVATLLAESLEDGADAAPG